MEDWKVPLGTVGFEQGFTVLQDGVVKNIEGHIVTLKVWRPKSINIKFSGVCPHVDAGNGTCKYTLKDGDVDKREDYYFSLVLTKDDDVIPTLPKVLKVIPGPPV